MVRGRQSVAIGICGVVEGWADRGGCRSGMIWRAALIASVMVETGKFEECFVVLTFCVGENRSCVGWEANFA